MCWVALLSGLACRSHSQNPEESKRTKSPDSANPPPAVSAPALQTSKSFELLAELPRCEIRHHGLVLDLGEESSRFRRGFELGPVVERIQRGDASFEALRARRARYSFWVTRPIERPEIVIRALAGSARTLTLGLDGQRATSQRLPPEEPGLIRFSVPGSVGVGLHTLNLSLSGTLPKGADVAFAELDWIRVGSAGEHDDKYAAPTLRNVLGDVVLGGTPRRAVSLPAPGSLRCSMLIGDGAVLRFDVGLWGTGNGQLSVRALTDAGDPILLREERVDEASGWKSLRIDLSRFSGEVVALDLEATASTPGSKVAFAEPKIEGALVPFAERRAKTVVLVVGAGLNRRSLPPWGPTNGLAALARLARSGVTFSGYRAPSTVPAAVVASLLTGLEPSAHTLEDQAARIPSTLRTLPRIVKESGGHTAFFTGAPTTFGAFGFGAGWDRFEMLSPVVDEASSEPLSRGLEWLERELADFKDMRHLLVLHIRGGHPPWDVSKKEAQELEPAEYDGVLDPRRGGVILGGIRVRNKRADRLLDAADWKRLSAFETLALQKQDAALGQMLKRLGELNALGEALIIFVGDVGSAEPPEVPYHPFGPLSEQRLAAPLIVKFPDGLGAGTESAVGVTATDVAATIAYALAVDDPDARPTGINLAELVGNRRPPVERALVATLGSGFASKLGPFRLYGEFGDRPRLCRADTDPACVEDVFEKLPFAAQLLWLETLNAETKSRTSGERVEREPASIDPTTAAALTVWGDIP
jgi:hypothetical protein